MYMKINKYIYLCICRGEDMKSQTGGRLLGLAVAHVSNILDTVGGLGMPAKDVAAVVHIVS